MIFFCPHSQQKRGGGGWLIMWKPGKLYEIVFQFIFLFLLTLFIILLLWFKNSCLVSKTFFMFCVKYDSSPKTKIGETFLLLCPLYTYLQLFQMSNFFVSLLLHYNIENTTARFPPLNNSSPQEYNPWF